ncbi:hypothetical protein J4421_00150 [Candidatus Woesearchaeota archaeon]|nr:hypothetical protein [Candidatus Woesearchaeota archaeon]
MQTFTLQNIPNLDTCVLAALELFSKTKLPSLPISKWKRPLVIGSGNAAAIGQIIFNDHDAVYANENSYQEKLLKIKNIDAVLIFSASGGKHAPLMAKEAKKRKKPVYLITNNQKALAAKELPSQNVFIFPKNREPYTYNTSTYLGMILGKTRENPYHILQFIEKTIAKLNFPNFQNYGAFYLLLPPQFELMREMLDKKFVEMFGRELAYSIFSTEYVKHATTIVKRPDELFISFGDKNTLWGKDRFDLPLPAKADYGSIMAVSYFIMGQIQKSKPPWFKKNIVSYCKEISAIFGNEIKPIVE